MTGYWLASYVVLWIAVGVLSVLLVGALRQIGALRLAWGHAPGLDHETIPSVENDGPPIGSRLPELTQQPVNAYHPRTASAPQTPQLLVCMSPMCDSCQHVVDPMNQLLAQREGQLEVTVLLRSDQQACHAFLSVFPIDAPVICDSNHDITRSLGVHRNPFGLLYDERAILIRKGIIKNQDELLALVGDPAASPRARAAVFPPMASVLPGERAAQETHALGSANGHEM